MSRWIYSLIWYVALPLVLLRLLWRSGQLPDYRRRIGERFGCIKPVQPGGIWLHTVSVGETLAAVRLVAELQRAYPALPLLVTCMTPTGSAQIIKSFGQTVDHCYAPYDMPDSIARFLNRAQPKILILLETELWPNWLQACQRRQIPVVLVNGRLSERSARGYRRFADLFRPLWPALALVAAQYEADAERFIGLGIAPERVSACGSLKFDLTLPDGILQRAAQLRSGWGVRPVWIAGCTHAGEERQILDCHQRLLVDKPDALLILVPRHPDRFDRVAREVSLSGLVLARRSRQQSVTAATQVYLGDTMGELLLLYAAADLAFVGGSLVDTGGHNLLEPAALLVPVLTGPSSFNFARITELLLHAQGLRQVESVDELSHALLELWQKPQMAQAQARAAAQVVAANRGALQRVLLLLWPQLEHGIRR